MFDLLSDTSVPYAEFDSCGPASRATSVYNTVHQCCLRVHIQTVCVCVHFIGHKATIAVYFRCY
jgi:hypothetical protein